MEEKEELQIAVQNIINAIEMAQGSGVFKSIKQASVIDMSLSKIINALNVEKEILKPVTDAESTSKNTKKTVNKNN